MQWSLDWAPRGWGLCNGDIFPIASYPALFSVIGNKYGGNGITTFAVPDFRGRIPVGAGTRNGFTYKMGQVGGVEAVNLTNANMPSHTHMALPTPGNVQISGILSVAADKADTPSPGSRKYIAGGYSPTLKDYSGDGTLYNFLPAPDDKMSVLKGSVKVTTATGNTAIDISFIGSGLPHNNMQPFLVMNYIIALTGTYPGW